MYFTITISHSYGLSDYFKPEKKITGKNSYRAYDAEDRAKFAFSKLCEYYYSYVRKNQCEVVLINLTRHQVDNDRTEIQMIYWKKNKLCVRGIII